MTIQEIIQQARNMSVTDQMRLVSQLVQLLEQTMQKTIPVVEESASMAAPTSAVGIIAELIKTPVAFEGPPLTRGEIYER